MRSSPCKRCTVPVPDTDYWPISRQHHPRPASVTVAKTPRSRRFPEVLVTATCDRSDKSCPPQKSYKYYISAKRSFVQLFGGYKINPVKLNASQLQQQAGLVGDERPARALILTPIRKTILPPFRPCRSLRSGAFPDRRLADNPLEALKALPDRTQT